MPKFSAGGPKRPPTPQYCSPWDEKGTILLLFNFCIHLHTYQDMQLKWYSVIGQKLRYRRPCTHDLPSTHNWLTQPHIASFLQISTILCWHYPGSLEWIAAPLSWLTPQPAPKRVCLWLVGLSTDPPISLISSKRVPIDNLRAQESIDRFKTSWKWLREFLEGRSQKVQTPSRDHPPSTPSDRTHLYINR